MQKTFILTFIKLFIVLGILQSCLIIKNESVSGAFYLEESERAEVSHLYESSDEYQNAIADPFAASLAKPTIDQIRYHEQERTSFVCIDPCTWQGREFDNHSTNLAEIKLESLDVDQWMKAAKSWGSKEIMFVAKHTGGFCWWPTETGDYNVKNIPWKGGKGDLVKEVAQACRRHGLNMGIYIYPGDDVWGAPLGSGGRTSDPADQEAYNKIFRKQYEEVFERCADIAIELYFDGSCIVPLSDIIEKWVGQSAAQMQGPNATLRWVGTEQGVTPYPAWNTVKDKDYVTGVSTAIHNDPDGNVWAPLQCNTTLYDHFWFWSKNNEFKRKSLKHLIKCYYHSVGRGMTFLLNSTPDTSGLIPEADMKLYSDFGKELDRRFNNPVGNVRGVGNKHEIYFEKPVRINQFMIMEDYRYGHRIRSYKVEIQKRNGRWKTVNTGTSVGRKRIVMFNPVDAKSVRLIIDENVGIPLIRSFKVYAIPGDNRFLYEKQFEKDYVVDITANDGNEGWTLLSECSKVDLLKGPSRIELDLRSLIVSPAQYYIKIDGLDNGLCRLSKVSLFYDNNEISDYKFREVIDSKMYLINRHAQVIPESEIKLQIDFEQNCNDNLPIQVWGKKWR
jgi:alpha-L-fucosidase